MSRKGHVWEDGEYIILRKMWDDKTSLRENAIAVARALGRTPDGVMSKAREHGLKTSWHGSRGHSGKPDGQCAMDIYRLKSPEDAWKRAWELAHGNRRYNATR